MISLVQVGNHNADQFNISLLLQQGVYVELNEEMSVAAFLTGLLSIGSGTLQKELATLFLNNRVVDDPNHTPVQPGDTLILSGAMPGLVGAMLRSNSPLKSMRSTITAGEPRNEEKNREEWVRLKLFNTVLKKYGPVILERGFWTDGE